MISVRAYQPKDYESIKALYQLTDTFGGQFDEDRDSAERIAEQIAVDPQSIFVAEENGQIIGTASVLQDKRFAWILRVAVSNERASQSLLQEISRLLRARGHKQVLVYAPAENQKFSDRYNDLGFQKGNEYDSYWRTLDS